MYVALISPDFLDHPTLSELLLAHSDNGSVTGGLTELKQTDHMNNSCLRFDELSQHI